MGEYLDKFIIFCEWQPDNDMWTVTIEDGEWYFDNVESEEYYDPTKLYFKSDIYIIDCLVDELIKHNVQADELVKYFMK